MADSALRLISKLGTEAGDIDNGMEIYPLGLDELAVGNFASDWTAQGAMPGGLSHVVYSAGRDTSI